MKKNRPVIKINTETSYRGGFLNPFPWIGRVFLGWWFWITNRNSWLARERLAFCVPCKYRRGMLCGECGCLLQAKARLEEERCPKNKWIRRTFYEGPGAGLTVIE